MANQINKLLVLGCGGFIGSHLLEHVLAHTHYQVVGVDLESGKIQEQLGHPHLQFIQGNIDELPNLEELICDAGVVISLTALCNPALYNKQPLRVIDANFTQPLRIVGHCARHHKWLVHFSTSEVYGKTVSALADVGRAAGEYRMQEETTHLILGPISRQRWTYSCAKQLLERVIFAAGKEQGMPFTIVRPFNFIGPRMDYIPHVDGVGIPRVLACFMASLLSNEPLLLVDGGRNRRVFTYIKDAIEAVVQILEKPHRSQGQIFNIGSPDNEVTIRELAEIMLHLYPKVVQEPLGRRCRIKEVSSQEFYGEGYDDSDRRFPDITLAQSLLGWQPKTGLEETLRKTIAGYVQHYKLQECLHA